MLPEGSAGSGGCSAGLGDSSEILEKLLRNSRPWIRNLDLGQAIWGLDKESGAWTSNLGLGTDCRELWLRYLGLGLVI